MGAVRYRFGDFELDPGAFQVRRAGDAVRIEKNPLELLLLLVERAGELVTRQEIARRLWGDGVYLDAEQGINTAIRKVRQALDDDSDRPAWVQTVVGKGYRFIGEVSIAPPAGSGSSRIEVGLDPGGTHTPAPADFPQTDDAARRRWSRQAVLALSSLALVAAAVGALRLSDALAPASATGIRSLAVLPLENLGDPAQQFFADGITDALITRIARLRNVRVISRTSSMHYRQARRPLPEIASELDVDAVVDGTITRSGNRVRVSARLVDARRDRHLWADEYDRDLSDILSVEAEVADQIARAVRTTVLETRTPAGVVDPAAYDHYLRGRSFWNQRTQEGLNQAIAEFDQAITLAPTYGEAFAGLADAQTALGYSSYRAPADAFPKARDAATRALALDPALAEAAASLGYVALYYDWDWATAESSFKRAIALNPNYATAHHWYSVFLTALGRHKEAAAEITRARQLDPLSLAIATDVGFERYYARQYDEATTELRKVLAVDPRFALAHLWLGRTFEARGMFAEAVGEFEQAQVSLRDWPVAIAAAGHALGRAGRTAEARRALAQLDALAASHYVTPYGVALVQDGLGDRDAALHWLDRACADRSNWLVWLALDPRFDDLRTDARFAALMARLRFPG